MSRRRTLAALATCAALVVVPNTLPAQVAAADGAPAAAPTRAEVRPLIQGVVVDQAGHPVDDVEVRAIRADGTVQASALTYASDREDGPQHGYFFLEVTRGTFTVKLLRDGYRTVEYDAGTISRRTRKISMGELVIKKAAADSITKAALEKATITTRQHGAATVTVTSKGRRPVGDVEVREGGHVVGDATIRRSDRGAVTIELARLPKGAHQLKAYFLGTAAFKASASRSFTLTVVKAKR